MQLPRQALVRERRALERRGALDRRTPVDWRRYSKHVRHARRRLPRYEHPVAISLAVSLVFTVAGLSLLQLVGVGMGAGLERLGSSLVGTIPKPQEGPLVLGEAPVSISAAPVLEGLPEFTRTNAVTLVGRVPAFAVGSGRTIAVKVNADALGTFPMAADGRFGGTTITLPDGTSTITARLVDGSTEIASTSATVVVDRAAPPLGITRPRPGDTVEGPDLVIEGKTEPGADVSVNDRAVRPNPDGGFSERLTPSPGALRVTVVARDKAGNETKSEMQVTVKPISQAPAVGTALSITIDRTRVRPSETVVARVFASDSGRPRADLTVTLQVGVITIGTYKTDASGTATIGFAAPNHEVEDVAIVILGGGASARATLTVSSK